MTQEFSELDKAYSPSTCVPDLNLFLNAYADLSAQARTELRWTELAYGDDPAERIDYFPTGSEHDPLLVYIHGGYWQELDKRDSAFMAPGLVSKHVNVAVLGYGLAPRFDLDGIVAMVRDGVRWLLESRSGGVFLAGSSAGAHLAAMCLLDESIRGRVGGAILLSGVYDLEPLVSTYINDAVGMDLESARRNSPIRHLPDRLPPLIVARGVDETSAFADQHEA